MESRSLGELAQQTKWMAEKFYFDDGFVSIDADIFILFCHLNADSHFTKRLELDFQCSSVLYFQLCCDMQIIVRACQIWIWTKDGRRNF